MLIYYFIFSLIVPISREHEAVLILARGGSKGVRLKNHQIVGGISLLGRAILTAKQAGLYDINVSTDHPLLALEAIKYGATVFQRSRVTATDWAPSIWGISEFLYNRIDIDTLILLQATSPFIRPEYLNKALQKLHKPIPYDCIFSATRTFKLRWSVKNGNLLAENFQVDQRPRRQDWSGELMETGAFYITRRTLLLEGKLQNNNCSVWEVSGAESLEIDTYYDLEVANVLLTYNLL